MFSPMSRPQRSVRLMWLTIWNTRPFCPANHTGRTGACGRPTPAVDRCRYAAGRQNDEHPALLDGAACVGPCGDIDPLGPPRPREIKGNRVGTHLGEIAAAG